MLGIYSPAEMVMEGTLWKWTNYFSGWQPRWFVLENGILSYYKSQDDVINGCKGSIKMAVCDVNVHGSDSARLDLIIPGEAHFYVRAATPQERQQWLVALGSSKACLTNGKPSQAPPEIPEEQLKAKKSELRLYCDLLMQQVHSVKTCVQTTETPSLQELNESTSLLSATCDTFIQTLDDCMKLASASTFDPFMSPDAPLSASPAKKSPSSKSVPWNAGGIQRSVSVDSSGYGNHRNTEEEVVTGYIPMTLRGHRGQRSRTSSRSASDTSMSDPNFDPLNRDTITPPKEKEEGSRRKLSEVSPSEVVPTFVSNMPTSFKDVVLLEDQGIPTVTFLDACRAILPIFDELNPTAFAPVKLDIAGNIRKIQQKCSTDTDLFVTLQKMVMFEISQNQHTNHNSATVALLWLKRGLDFSRDFVLEYLGGVDDLSLAANTAYGRTLKPYHSWVVRGVFALAVKAVPTKPEFLQHLSLDGTGVGTDEFERSVMKDLDDFVNSLDRVLAVLNHFYTAHDLDSDEQV